MAATSCHNFWILRPIACSLHAACDPAHLCRPPEPLSLEGALTVLDRGDPTDAEAPAGRIIRVAYTLTAPHLPLTAGAAAAEGSGQEAAAGLLLEKHESFRYEAGAGGVVGPLAAAVRALGVNGRARVRRAEQARGGSFSGSCCQLCLLACHRHAGLIHCCGPVILWQAALKTGRCKSQCCQEQLWSHSPLCCRCQ